MKLLIKINIFFAESINFIKYRCNGILKQRIFPNFKISDASDFELKMDMKNYLQNAFLNEMADYKFRLPNIKSIEISKIGIKDKNVQVFFQHCIPCKLANILIDIQFDQYDTYKYNTDKYYDTNSICKALLNVNKQICLSGFYFNEDHLKEIIKSSLNCEILIFDTCVIKFSKELEFHILKQNNFTFNISKEYKIKYLCFKNCGDKCSSKHSDWVECPSKFINIIKAISKSELKSSLQKVGIYNCSLNIILVQKWFDEFGMSHVEVVG